MCSRELDLVTTDLQNKFVESQLVCSSHNLNMGMEVSVSNAGMGAVVPVRAAGTTTSTLSEADIAIIVDRVTRNLQLPAAGGSVGRQLSTSTNYRPHLYFVLRVRLRMRLCMHT